MLYQRVGRACFAAVLLGSLLGGGTLDAAGVAQAQPSPAALRCVVLPSLPLSVGFADGTTTKSLQAQDVAIRDVLRGVKSWLCGPATTSQYMFAESLRSAI